MLLNYTVKGQGKKAIILLHGWGGSLNSLSKLQNHLVDFGNSRVYNIEWPGFGESPLAKSGAGLNEYAQYLKEFIQSQNLIKPILVGHSFGGKVAMALIISDPKIAERLVLINSSGIKPKNTLKKAILIVPTKLFGIIFSLPLLKYIKPLVRKLYYRTIVREADYVQSNELKDSLKKVLNENLDEKVKNIGINTLLIWGEKDTKTPLWMGKFLKEEIENSKLEIVKDAKHNLPLTQPELVATIISLFIK